MYMKLTRRQICYLTGSTVSKGALFLLDWLAAFLGFVPGSAQLMINDALNLCRIARACTARPFCSFEATKGDYLALGAAWGRSAPVVALDFEQSFHLVDAHNLTFPPFYSV